VGVVGYCGVICCFIADEIRSYKGVSGHYLYRSRCFFLGGVGSVAVSCWFIADAVRSYKGRGVLGYN
jgi:hypothetical protein